jgi:hypothetical protein
MVLYPEAMRFTRRKLAGALLGSAAARSLAQTASPLPRTPDEELKAARERLKSRSDTLAAQAVPMSTEPAFQFKA